MLVKDIKDYKDYTTDILCMILSLNNLSTYTTDILCSPYVTKTIILSLVRYVRYLSLNSLYVCKGY